jgi:uncharacterized protein
MSDPYPMAERLKQHFGMQPLAMEGGAFAETYRSSETLPADRLPVHYPAESEHAFGTAILYLLDSTPGSFSALHRLPSDEIFHFYLGDPVEMLLLFPDGGSRHVTLGPDVFAGQQVQFVVPAGVWQGSRLRPGGDYALLGTTMSPGFAPSDYEGGNRDALLAQYSSEAQLIRKLTRI